MTDRQPQRALTERPIPRMVITWMVALAVYFGVRFAEGRDLSASLPRSAGEAEARADQLAAHVTRTVARTRDAERARLAGLCESIAFDGEGTLARRVLSWVAESELRDLSVLRPAATGDAPVAFDYRRPGVPASEAPGTSWATIQRDAPRLPQSGHTTGIARGLASELPSSEGLSVSRFVCRAASPAGTDHVVVGHLDVVRLATEAVPAELATVALETEATRAPGLRRWLGPAEGDAPRPALRARVMGGPAPRPTFLLAPLLAAIVSALATFFALRPRAPRGALGTLEAAAERIGRGDLEVELPRIGGAADGTFTAFNRMTRELKEARERLVRAERVAAWRDVARRIAHEIKNPLTPIRMAIETLRKAKQRQHPDLNDIFEESTVAVLEEVGRMEKIVSEFSRFARMPRPRAEAMDVREVAEHVVQVHRLPAEVTQSEGDAAAEVELVADAELPEVRADREQLVQVLTNLVQNAIDAAKSKTPERPRVRVKVMADAGGVRIEIHDNGPGIHADEAQKVLEPYYTTKEKGTGLGLAIVDRIVADHGGALRIGESSDLGGACFTVTLRREGPPEEASSSRPSQP